MDFTTIIDNPVTRTIIVSAMISVFSSVCSLLGRMKAEDGSYVRKPGILGIFWLGKVQWLWGVPLALLAVALGEAPELLSKTEFVSLTTLISIGWHSLAKNAGKEFVWEYLAEKIGGKLDKTVGGGS